MRTSGRLVVAVMAGLLVAAAVVATPYVRTAAFLLDLAGVENGIRRWIPITPIPYATRDADAPTRHGPIPVRIYVPEATAVPTVVVFPGVHGGGVESPRLASLCGRLSGSGLRVICAPLPDLRQFLVTGRSTDMIEDVTRWATEGSDPDRIERVTLVGVSFAGGLAIVAAGRESLRDRLTAVVSIGGHGDLRRTLEFVTTGVLPDGSRRTPHDYPLAILALTLAPELVPAGHVELTQERIRTFLNASLDDGSGFAHGIPTMQALQAEVETLPEPIRPLLGAIVTRDIEAAGRMIAPFVEVLGDNPALSPALAPLPTAPVFLLHGTDDNIIPSSETPLLTEDLRRRSPAPVRALLTPLLTHAHLSTSAPPADLWALLQFWHAVRETAAAGAAPAPLASGSLAGDGTTE